MPATWCKKIELRTEERKQGKKIIPEIQKLLDCEECSPLIVYQQSATKRRKTEQQTGINNTQK